MSNPVVVGVPAWHFSSVLPSLFMSNPTEFPGLDVWYGQMWMLYLDPDAPEGTAPVAFGHGGSDGTAAWVFPDRDLIILYFTQSRGGATVIRFEETIDRLLINPGAGVEAAALPQEWEDYLGTYTGREGAVRNQEYTVVARDGHLAVDIPEGLVVDLEEAEEEMTQAGEATERKGE